MIAKDELIEYARYVDNYYGTPRAYVEEQLDAGKDVILEIEMQGALQVKKTYPDTILIFITPPSAAELRRRLTARGTETKELIEKRLKRAVEEGVYMDQYDYIIVNDDLDVCVKELDALMQSTHHAVKFNKEFVAAIKDDLKTL